MPMENRSIPERALRTTGAFLPPCGRTSLRCCWRACLEKRRLGESSHIGIEENRADSDRSLMQQECFGVMP